MQFDLERTIVAVSSGLAPARRAVLRISGSATRHLLSKIVAAEGRALLDAQSATARPVRIHMGWGDRTCPATVYYWPDQRSYTGEPSAEIHLLGSLPLVQSLTDWIVSLGAYPAERGEFTLRSFLAGKLDLTQAEAVLGVIEADSAEQLNTALQQLGGNLSQPIRTLREQIVEFVAHLEAGLDFVDEDIEFISAEQLCHALDGIAEQLRRITDQLQTRGVRGRAPRVVLVGLPNAGKSTLFNALLQQDRSIVTPRAGTTRDAVVHPLRIGEQHFDLVDTAGLEELRDDSPRSVAQQVLGEQLAQADVLLLCVDLSNWPGAAWIQAQVSQLAPHAAHLLLVGTKLDLLPSEADILGRCDVMVSPHLSDGLLALQSCIAEQLAATARGHSTALHETAVRCRDSLQLAHQAIERAREIANSGNQEELVAAELRHALDDLAAVIGDVHSDDILGEIFSRFCIGK